MRAPTTEELVISEILNEPLVIFEVMDRVKAECFADKKCKFIFEACLKIIEDGGKCEINLIVQMLEKAKKLEAIGGLDYINQLTKLHTGLADIQSYIKIVVEDAQMRLLRSELAKLLTYAKKPRSTLKSSSEKLNKLQDDLTGFKGGTELEMLKDVVARMLSQMDQTTPPALSTGYKTLDNTIGGFRRSDLIILAGRTGQGKTGIALNFVLNALTNKKNVLFFNLEMSNEQVLHRLLGAKTGTEIWKFTNNDVPLAMREKLSKDLDEIGKSNLYLNKVSDLNMGDMRAATQRLSNKVDIDLIVVDYLQLTRKNEYKSTYSEVSAVSQGLKALARDLNIPVLALAQLNRKAEDSPKPQLHHLRDSGSIEQDADLVVLIHRPYSNNPNAVQLDIAKHRHGEAGRKILFNFNPQTQRYSIMTCSVCDKNHIEEECKADKVEEITEEDHNNRELCSR